MSVRKIRICLSILLILPAVSVHGGPRDAKQHIYLDDWSYALIDYWINNGTFRHNYVLNQPYTVADLDSGYLGKSHWRPLQQQYYRRAFGTQGHGKFLLYGRANAAAVTDSELPVRSGFVQPPVDNVALYDNRSKMHYNFAAQFNVLLPHIALVNRTIINSEFKDDPLFFGDTGEWIHGKSSDAYVNVNAGPFDVFLGRMDRNWGTPGSPGMLLSNTPYSYDQAHFTFTSRHFKFSLLVTRLEDLYARSDEDPDMEFLARKFLTAHRADFSVSENLQFGLSEVAIYGGPDRDFEIGFLNPMNYFYLVQRNQNQQMSGLWSLDLFYKPHRNLNTFFAFLIDDIIVNNEPDQNDRANYPDRFGLNLKLSEADLVIQGLQSKLGYTKIWNRTYQSRRTYENYHYYSKGLGYPRASTERFDFGLNYFSVYPLLLEFDTVWQRSGDVNLTDLFPLKKEPFPIEVVEEYFLLRLDTTCFLSPAFRLTLSSRYERWQNFQHLSQNNRNNLSVVLGLQLNLGLGFRLL